MLERALGKGTVIDGPTAAMFFKQDPTGSAAEVEGGSVEFSLDLPGGGKADGVYLPYRPNGINYVAQQGRDVISSQFTGCYMVKYTVGGATRIAHVATPECKDAWAAMKARADVKVLAEFKPSDHVDVALLYGGSSDIAKGEVLGIITGSGYCIAVAAFRSGEQNRNNTQLRIAQLVLVKVN